MKILGSLFTDQRATAAAEMAMIVPLLLTILFGSVELGNYFYNEHKLVKAVRDGARYAARQQFSNYSACTGTPSGNVYDNTKLMVRKGKLDNNAPDLLPLWGSVATNCSGNPAGGCLEVTMSCTPNLEDPSGNTLTLGGIYTASSSAPTVVVSARVPYFSVLGTTLGFDSTGIFLNARQSAAVAGL